MRAVADHIRHRMILQLRAALEFDRHSERISYGMTDDHAPYRIASHFLSPCFPSSFNYTTSLHVKKVFFLVLFDFSRGIFSHRQQKTIYYIV